MIKKFSAFASFVSLVAIFGVSSAFATDPRVEQGARFEAKGEYDKALGEYRSILADDPRNSEAYFLAAEARMKMKDYSGALANYRLAYRYSPNMSEAYEGAAKVYEALGQRSKAEAERAKDPKNKPAVEDVQEPAETVEQVAAAPAPAEVATPEEKHEETVASSKSSTANSGEQESVSEKRKAIDSRLNDIDDSRKSNSESAETAVAEEEDPFEVGKKLFNEGKYEEAAPYWKDVLAKHPGDAGAYFYAGLTRYELGEYDKAEYNLKKGLTYRVRGVDANYFLSLVYQKTERTNLEKRYLMAYLKKASPTAIFRKPAENRLAELNAPAEPAGATVSAADSKVDEASVNPIKGRADKVAKASDGPTIATANALFKSGNPEGALKVYKELLEKDLNPEERYFAMLQMGNIYRSMRDFHSAVNRYREIVQMFPDSDWATEAERAQMEAVWQEKHAAEFPREKKR